MKKLSTLEELQVRTVIVNYIDGLIEDYENNLGRLDEYLDEIRLNEDAVIAFLNDSLLEYKTSGALSEFVAQRFMIDIFNKFIENLPDIDKSINCLKEILDTPEKYLYDNIDSFQKEFLPETVQGKIVGAKVEHRVAGYEYPDFEVYDILTLYLKISGKSFKITAYENIVSDYSDCGGPQDTVGYCNMISISDYDIHEKTRTPLPMADMTVDLPYAAFQDCLDLGTIDIFEYLEAKEPYSDSKIFEIPGVLKVDDVGNDVYYPSGSCEYNLDNFTKSIREFDKPPVWIIKGDSGSGKTYLTSLIKDKTVFETDNHNELPKHIFADIIVIGNRHSDLTVERIESLIPYEHETILVDFSMSR